MRIARANDHGVENETEVRRKRKEGKSFTLQTTRGVWLCAGPDRPVKRPTIRVAEDACMLLLRRCSTPLRVLLRDLHPLSHARTRPASLCLLRSLRFFLIHTGQLGTLRQYHHLIAFHPFLLSHLCRLALHRPDLGAPIPPTADQILVDEPHPFRWLGMPIDHHPIMSVRGPVVHLDPVLSCASDDFARVELEGSDGVFVPVGFGYCPGSNVPDL
jgi:hypothetical protein